MVQVGDTARSIRLLADFLDRHPEALVRGRSGCRPRDEASRPPYRLLLASCASPGTGLLHAGCGARRARGGAPSLVELRRPGWPAISTGRKSCASSTEYQLRVSSGERWGEPFGDMVRACWPRTSTPACRARASSPRPGRFRRCGGDDRDGRAALRPRPVRPGAVPGAGRGVPRPQSRERAKARAIRVTVTPASPATADYVAAMSNALGQAADQIADMLRGGREPLICPAYRVPPALSSVIPGRETRESRRPEAACGTVGPRIIVRGRRDGRGSSAIAAARIETACSPGLPHLSGQGWVPLGQPLDIS